MKVVLVLLLVAVATWMLRVALIAVVPPERLPEWVRTRLGDVAPAAFAAMIAVHLGNSAAVAPAPTLVAGGAAALAGWRTRNPIVTVTVGLATFVLVDLLAVAT
ncbi:AzlD domain-containing protein [Egicoccus sp. AB-alg2]|uniref:AzlD domain-containing protein n=1 Tax=Egicoccus sp. AB-alg2 TaxID=3242693 RepID=UPI00359EE1CE